MISIVIPAYQEEEAIAPTLENLRVVVDGMNLEDVEIIVVDDGSTDRTAEIAESRGATVIRKAQNIGYGHSLKIGINAARHDTIVIMDADGTYPSEEIPRLLDIYDQGFHMVVGQRTGKHLHESWVKAPLRRILRLIVEFTTGQPIPDPNSGLRVFSKADITPLFPFLSNAFSFTISSTLAYSLNYYYITYAKIPYHERIGSTKVLLVRDSLRVMQYIVSAILYYNPIKLFLLICIAQTLVGLPLLLIGVAVDSSWLIVIGLVLLGMMIPVFTAGLIVEAIRQYLLRPRTNFTQTRRQAIRPKSDSNG